MEFVIDTPPYINFSVGIRVLHRLCHLLNEHGILLMGSRAHEKPISEILEVF